MEICILSLDAILAKVVKERAESGKWNGDQRGYWRWTKYFTMLLQKEKIYHWLDRRTRLVPYPQEAYNRRRYGVFNQGDSDWIKEFQKEDRARDMDSQKAIAMLRENLGATPLGIIDPILDDHRLSQSERVIAALNALQESFARFQLDVMSLIRKDIAMLPVAENEKDLRTLIHMINCFDEELGTIHQDYRMQDFQKKIELTQKISRKFTALHLEIVRNLHWNFRDVQDLCERYRHIGGPTAEASMVMRQPSITFEQPCNLLSQGDQVERASNQDRRYQEERRFPKSDKYEWERRRGGRENSDRSRYQEQDRFKQRPREGERSRSRDRSADRWRRSDPRDESRGRSPYRERSSSSGRESFDRSRRYHEDSRSSSQKSRYQAHVAKAQEEFWQKESKESLPRGQSEDRKQFFGQGLGRKE